MEGGSRFVEKIYQMEDPKTCSSSYSNSRFEDNRAPLTVSFSGKLFRKMKDFKRYKRSVQNVFDQSELLSEKNFTMKHFRTLQMYLPSSVYDRTFVIQLKQENFDNVARFLSKIGDYFTKCW